MRVLVVDDDKLARKGLISIMNWEKYGFEVVGDVQNGSKALEFLKDNMVDVVFTDIDMPEIDGIELMERCRTEYPDVPEAIRTEKGISDETEAKLVKAIEECKADFLK